MGDIRNNLLFCSRLIAINSRHLLLEHEFATNTHELTNFKTCNIKIFATKLLFLIF